VNPDLERFLYVSSIAAAGPSAPGLTHDEAKPPSPVSEYGRSKLAGEMAVKAQWDQLPATIIRPPNVYGPGQQETELLFKLIRKRICPVLKERGKTTSLIYIKDLISGILQAALNPKAIQGTYFMTDGQFYSWREIILTLKKQILDRSLSIPVHESAIFSVALLFDLMKALNISKSRFGRRAWKSMTQRTWLFSSEKAANDFGFAPEYTLTSGVQDMLDHKETHSFPNA
jgi:nucleoside-diphosphate-sugar epimerase